MVDDIEGIKASLVRHAEVFDDLLRMIPPKFYLPEINEEALNRRFMKNTKKMTPIAKKEAMRKERASAKAARLDPENNVTVQDMQAQKLERQVVEKLKIADSPKRQKTNAMGAGRKEDMDVEDDGDDGEAGSARMSGMAFDLGNLESTQTPAQSKAPAINGAEIKPMVAPGSINELRMRLQNRISLLRQKRKAPSDDVSREALLEKRLSRRKNKEVKAKAKKSAKVTQEQVLGSKTPSAINGVNGQGKGSGGEVKESIYFGKLTSGETKKKPIHVRQQLVNIENKKKELAELKKTDAAKAEAIEEKDRWSKALDQAKGEKVKDDPTLLRKTVRRMEQKKSKSSREWNDRKNQQDNSKKERAQKREANLKARIDSIKMKKQGKSKKSIERVLKGAKNGGITKKNTGGNSKARPGFEGKKAGAAADKKAGKKAGKKMSRK
ncbi:hypothetical protein GGI07_003333 [Coemansia sp. Benny D115]|nr:hypothetical protein GGI07_003333 [Coemansia sp. Benny D115]